MIESVVGLDDLFEKGIVLLCMEICKAVSKCSGFQLVMIGSTIYSYLGKGECNLCEGRFTGPYIAHNSFLYNSLATELFTLSIKKEENRMSSGQTENEKTLVWIFGMELSLA